MDTTREHENIVYSQNMRMFSYQPLDTTKRCIRLLKVLPRKGNEPIRCQIRHVNLDNRPRFIALSYTWDQAEGIQKYVLCEGASMRIGKNLWDFLDRYSQESGYAGVRLWVDAVCIDQTNLHERNHQVSLMRTIYTRAQTVIAWLGAPTGNEALAFRVTEDYAILDSVQGQDAIANLFQKRYWSRVWIVQEIILPRTVRIWCGDLAVNADAFDLPWPTLLLRRLKTQGCAWQILRYRRIWHAQQPGQGGGDAFHLCQLIRAFASSQSSERLDKIYGFLGLASAYSGYEARIEVDYSISTLQLLIDVLRFERDTGANKDHLLADLHHLKTLLGVTSMELAASVRELSNDLLPHLYGLLGCDEVVVPLYFVGKMVSVQDPRVRRKHTPSSKRARLKNLLTRDHMKEKLLRGPRKHSLDDPEVVVMKAANECCWQAFQTESHLDAEFIRGSAKVLLDGLLDAWNDPASRPYRNGTHKPPDAERISDLFLQSLNGDQWTSAIQNEGCARYDHWTSKCVRLSFADTSGGQGILVTAEATRQNLLTATRETEIWRLNGPSECAYGLLVGKNSTGTWDCLGVTVSTSTAPPRHESGAALASDCPGPLWARLQLPDLFRMLRYLPLLSKLQLRALYRLWLTGVDTGHGTAEGEVLLWPVKGPPSRLNNWDRINHSGEVPHMLPPPVVRSDAGE